MVDWIVAVGMDESNTYTFGPKSGSPAAGVAGGGAAAGAATSLGVAADADDANATAGAAASAVPEARVRKPRRPNAGRPVCGCGVSASVGSLGTAVVLSKRSGRARCVAPYLGRSVAESLTKFRFNSRK